MRATMMHTPLSLNQLPERAEFLDAIPRTSTGKFWKVKLRAMFR
jgi:acyl-CoA synthetase (AMP-forming)/AMP-acid ligase II